MYKYNLGDDVLPIPGVPPVDLEDEAFTALSLAYDAQFPGASAALLSAGVFVYVPGPLPTPDDEKASN